MTHSMSSEIIPPFLFFSSIYKEQLLKADILPYRSLSRTIHTSASADELCFLMDTWGAGIYCSLDIEGGLPKWLVNAKALAKPKDKDRLRYGWPCVSLSPDPSRAWSIAWGRYTETDHVRLLRAFAKLMYRDDVPKVLQNQLYDNFVLSFGYGIPIRNVTQDTMIKGWAVYAELPRGLSTQGSIWTRQPHWKDDTMYGTGIDNLAHGCGMDSAVTLEICLAQDNALSPESMKHYKTIIDLQNCFLFMELNGIKYDQPAVTTKLRGVQKKLDKLGAWLDKQAKGPLRGPKGSLSSKKLCDYLYASGGYPKQFAKVNGRLTTKLTSDKDALLKLKNSIHMTLFLPTSYATATLKESARRCQSSRTLMVGSVAGIHLKLRQVELNVTLLLQAPEQTYKPSKKTCAFPILLSPLDMTSPSAILKGQTDGQ